jgi:hypothetical protein
MEAVVNDQQQDASVGIASLQWCWSVCYRWSWWMHLACSSIYAHPWIVLYVEYF